MLETHILSLSRGPFSSPQLKGKTGFFLMPLPFDGLGWLGPPLPLQGRCRTSPAWVSEASGLPPLVQDRLKVVQWMTVNRSRRVPDGDQVPLFFSLWSKRTLLLAPKKTNAPFIRSHPLLEDQGTSSREGRLTSPPPFPPDLVAAGRRPFFSIPFPMWRAARRGFLFGVGVNVSFFFSDASRLA